MLKMTRIFVQKTSRLFLQELCFTVAGGRLFQYYLFTLIVVILIIALHVAVILLGKTV